MVKGVRERSGRGIALDASYGPIGDKPAAVEALVHDGDSLWLQVVTGDRQTLVAEVRNGKMVSGLLEGDGKRQYARLSRIDPNVPAAARPAQPYTGPALTGTWKAVWQTPAGTLQQARLVVSQSGGTWKTAASSRSDPCVGLEVPIRLEKAKGDRPVIRLLFSEALRGCNDSSIRVTLADEEQMAGTRGKTHLVMVRD